MATPGECPTCCEAYTSVVRTPVTCAYCQYTACNACCRQYITGTMLDAHCMSCRHTWTREVLVASFTPAWMNGAYKAHRETVLVEREKQLLPATQAVLPNYREAKRLRALVAEKTSEAADLKRRYHAMCIETQNDKVRLARVTARGYRGVGAAAVEARNAAAAADNDDDDAPGTSTAHKKKKKPKKASFIAPCSADGCRGFMSADTMQCGVCALKACPRCSATLPDDDDDDGDGGAHPHACDANDVASFEAIKQQTRACPTCAVPTFKIDGCSQKWCVACNTAWDWNTREIARGVVHNPHYFAYLRAGGGGEARPDANNRPACENGGCIPSGWDVDRAARGQLAEAFPAVKRADRDTWTDEYEVMAGQCVKLQELQQAFLHVHNVVRDHLARRHAGLDEAAVADNADLRLKYLEGEVDETAFKARLQRREKARAKVAALRDVYAMACDVARDVLRNFIHREVSPGAAVTELQRVREYANEHLTRIRTQYKIKADPV